MDSLTPSQWIVRCAQQLAERWKTVPAPELEEAAMEVWRDAALRALAPEDAARRWLAPITSSDLGEEGSDRDAAMP